MNNKQFYRAFFSMTLTMALQNLIVFGVNLADSVMMGAYNETALSGVGICNNIQYFLSMAVIGASAGMSVIVSRYWGMKEKEPIYKVSAISMWMGLGFCAVITVICALFPRKVIMLYTDKTAVIEQAVEYLSVIKYTYILYGVTTVILAILRSVETVKIGFYVSISSFGLNVLLNYMLIYGRLGAPELGVKGAAWATLAARAVEFIVVLIYLFAVDKKLKFNPVKLLKTERKLTGDYFRTGLPLMASNILWGIAMSIQGAIIGRFEEGAIAANAIVSTMFQIATVITFASANAACVLTGKTIGERADLETIKKRSKGLQLIFLGIGIVSSVILLSCKTFILGFYAASAETVRYTNTFIWILAITIIGTSYECPALTGIVSGGGDTAFVLKNDIIWMWMIVLPISALSAFVFKWPVAVTFMFLKADQVLKCIVAFFKVRKYNWIKKLS